MSIDCFVGSEGTLGVITKANILLGIILLCIHNMIYYNQIYIYHHIFNIYIKY